MLSDLANFRAWAYNKILTLKIISSKIKAGTLWEYSVFVQKCEEILNDVFLLLCTNFLIASAYYIVKTPNTSTRLFQILNLSVCENLFMNNQYIQYPLKRSLKPVESISAFRSMVGNTNRVFTVLGFCTNFVCRDSRARIFQKLHTRQFFPFFHQNFH